MFVFILSLALSPFLFSVVFILRASFYGIASIVLLHSAAETEDHPARRARARRSRPGCVCSGLVWRLCCRSEDDQIRKVIESGECQSAKWERAKKKETGSTLRAQMDQKLKSAETRTAEFST